MANDTVAGFNLAYLRVSFEDSGAGLMAEHHHTRNSAGLFDVSHMGQLRLVGPEAAAAFETLMPVDVMGLALGKQRYGLLLTGGGIAFGMAAAVGLTRWMTALLFGVEATDPLTFLGVAAVLAAVALLASVGASIRAAGVDPNDALRAE